MHGGRNHREHLRHPHHDQTEDQQEVTLGHLEDQLVPLVALGRNYILYRGELTAVTLLGLRPAPGDGRRSHPAPPLLLCPGGRDGSLLQDLRIFPSSLLHSGHPQPHRRHAGEVRRDRLPLPLQVPLHPRQLQEGGHHRLGPLHIPGHPGDLDQGELLA